VKAGDRWVIVGIHGRLMRVHDTAGLAAGSTGWCCCCRPAGPCADEKKHFPQQTSLQAAKALASAQGRHPAGDRRRRKKKPRHGKPPAAAPHRDGEAEARLIEVYRLIGQARGREALARPRRWCATTPTSSWRSWCYGDLLSSQTRPVRMRSAMCPTPPPGPAPLLAELRDESQLRLRRCASARPRAPCRAVPALRRAPSTRLRWMPRARGCTCSRTPPPA
jgi:hypothetical protein